MRTFLRWVLLVLAGHAATVSMACTAFVSHHGGRTFIGNNEDAWSINPQVRFEQGRNGAYGAMYFGHFNGHPLRHMIDQIGMNEVGLVCDGLAVQPKSVRPMPGRKLVPFDELMPLVMRTCRDVQEAAALLRTMDTSWLTQSMLFLADRSGSYLIVEADTLILGTPPAYAVGNWRMSTCTDPDAIPIPRLQQGRALLAAGPDSSFNAAREVLARMAVCRKKMGEGTLFSTLFDPKEGTANLYFYHDFDQAVIFDLKSELTKGDRTVDMASLFGARPEFERLKSYRTPFHQRWLFWGLLAWMGLTVIAGLWALFALVHAMFKQVPGRGGIIAQALLAGVCSVLTFALIGVLLMQEGPYYFGLGDVSPWLTWLPVTLATLLIVLLVIRLKHHAPRVRGTIIGAVIMLPLMFLLTYWDLWWP